MPHKYKNYTTKRGLIEIKSSGHFYGIMKWQTRMKLISNVRDFFWNYTYVAVKTFSNTY